MLDTVLDKARNMANDLSHAGCFLFRQERFRAVVCDDSRGWSKSLACVTKIAAITYVGVYALALESSSEVIDKETFLAVFALLGVTSLIAAMPLCWVIRVYAEPAPKVRAVVETLVTGWTIFAGLLLLTTILALNFIVSFGSEHFDLSDSERLFFVAIVTGATAFVVCALLVGSALYAHIKKLANCEGEISAVYLFLWFSTTYGLTTLVESHGAELFVDVIKTLKNIL